MFTIKNCYHLMNSVYPNGREVHDECGNSLTDEKCQEVKDCHLKKIAENLLKVVEDPACRRCDGCGYEEGCADEACGTYAAYKCLELLDIKFFEDIK